MKCLFLTASTSACAGEVTLVRDCLKNLGIECRELEWISPEDFLAQMQDGTKYDFIYLGAHADGSGFGESDGMSLHAWNILGQAICSTHCMMPNGTLFLGCCRGGMKTVALKILKTCDKIDYICGPHWKVTGNDLTAAFQAFVQSRIKRNEEPFKAAERATEACGFRFSCYDRQELEAEIETLREIAANSMTLEWLVFQVNEVRQAVQSLAKSVDRIAASLASNAPPQSSSKSSPESQNPP